METTTIKYVVCLGWFMGYSIGLYANDFDKPLIVTSIPKCGTHLLDKLIFLLTHKQTAWVSGFTHLSEKANLDGAILKGHLVYGKHNVALIEKSRAKVVFIYRDLRDQLLSALSHMKRCRCWLTEGNMSEPFISLPLAPALSTLMQKGFSIGAGKPWVAFPDWYNLFLLWKDHPNVYAVKFEDLVGPKGGGLKEKPLREIKNIAKHLEIALTDERANDISKQLFGGTDTFRKGKIGTWKEHFTEEHKAAFKKVAGQLLIDLGYEKDMNW